MWQLSNYQGIYEVDRAVAMLGESGTKLWATSKAHRVHLFDPSPQSIP